MRLSLSWSWAGGADFAALLVLLRCGIRGAARAAAGSLCVIRAGAMVSVRTATLLRAMVHGQTASPFGPKGQGGCATGQIGAGPASIGVTL
jgi:hypothetical protein